MNREERGHPKELLSAYLDDQLSVEERASVDRHLADCDECRVELEAHRILARAVADEEPPPVPLDLAGRIARSLDGAEGVRRHRRRFVVPATIAATITAIGILIALQWREGRISVPVAPSMPESQQQAPAADELQRQNAPAAPSSAPAPAPPPPAARTLEAPPLEKNREEKAEDTRRDSMEKDFKTTVAPTPEQTLKQKAGEGASAADTAVDGARERAASKVAAPEARTAVGGGVVGGVVGGIAGGVEGGVEGGVPGGVSPCAEQWSDSGVRGGWEVKDVDAAARELGRIAADAGGTSQWRGATDGRPFLLIVPRGRFDEVFYALRARGLTGLVTPPRLPDDTACAAVSVTLTAVPR